MGKVKVGLALGSGAARGLAHIGVIKALNENGISIDVIAGTSIGAVVGGLYAAGLSVGQMEEFAAEFGGRRLTYWMDPAVFWGGGLLKGNKIEEALRRLTGPIDFAGLKTPFFAVASDLITGREVIVSKGDIYDAIRASFAIPGIFAPVEYEGGWLVDGALAEPIPTSILARERCDVIIAVNVSSLPKGGEALAPKGTPKIMDVFLQVLAIAELRLSVPCMKRAHVGITPPFSGYVWTDFYRFDELIKTGYDAALKAMPQIKKRFAHSRRYNFVKRIFTDY